MVDKINIRSLTFSELEQTIEHYPWFALARRELCRRLVAAGRGDIRKVAHNAALFVPDRSRLYLLEYEDPMPQEEKEPAQRTITHQNVRIVMAGGDYFSKEDFEELENSGEGYKNVTFSPAPLRRDEEPYISSYVAPKQLSPDDMICTETLARIYADQGFDGKAIETYEKLILIYPEKSIYFASLIEKIKTKNN
ncbi:MAG: hypothetical protein HUJ90_02490 [Bacteroidales bacterium]|nr:hypothetical protein [Bacteroidales bacterium]